jgi:uncharacterized protein (DUF1330 family)
MTIIKLPHIKPGQGPVLMLSLIKFKDRKIYFEQYIPAFGEVVKHLGIEGVTVKLVSKVVVNVIADEHEQWDEMVLVEYPNAESFNAIAKSEVYQTIADRFGLPEQQN